MRISIWEGRQWQSGCLSAQASVTCSQIDAAVGVSLAGQSFDEGLFELGVGGYLGASYYLNDTIALLIGCNIGYDMLSVSLDSGEIGFSGDFYVSPSLSVGFRY